MVQLAVFIYGIVVLFRGVFSLGARRQVVGTRARILGLMCVMILPVAFVVGFTWAMLAHNGMVPLPGQTTMLFFDLGILVVSLVVIYMLGNHFYRLQEAERERMAEPVDAGPAYSVADPENPYASPTREQ